MRAALAMGDRATTLELYCQLEKDLKQSWGANRKPNSNSFTSG